ncbi:hypothetical protein LG315_10895 [Microbacterium marinum]|uniref:hypothetical protein n=1 Tax=Microbacterium marinum TaxID=421115 RepID=UPI00384C1CD2
MLADPSYLEASLRAYYGSVERIVLSYDETGTSWTGTPLPVRQCLEIARTIDVDRKCVEVPGRFARPGADPLESETIQRQHALDAASSFGKWVLQLDTDEVMLSADTFFASLRAADGADAGGLDFPARWLYTRVGTRRYLEQTDRFWRRAASYPGPLAVRAGTRLKLARQADVQLFRVDFRRTNTDPWHPADAQVDTVIPADESVVHFSWVRQPEVIRRKFRWSGHTEDMKPPQVYRRWEWRTRHPRVTVALTPLRARSRAWYRLSTIPEPPGGVPIHVEYEP